MKSPIIQLKDLTKSYGDKIAVNNLNLEILPGEIFGLLGPNGAGKTTSILMMLGLTDPSSGKAYVCGHDATREPIAVKQCVGYLPDNVGFYPDMTALENLVFISRINGFDEDEALTDAQKLLEVVGLQDAMKQKTATFSRGMKQRLGLAEVLIKKPKIIILDEPTLGIDPKGVQEFLRLIQQLSRDQHLTVLMSSHHLHQVQQVCDRVGIFVDGKMIVEGPIENLSKQLMSNHGCKTSIRISNSQTNRSACESTLNELAYIQSYSWDNDYLHVISSNSSKAEIIRKLVFAGADIESVEGDNYTLDDIYAKYFDQTKFLSIQDEKQYKNTTQAG